MNDLTYVCAPRITEKALHTLEGIVHGIAADNKINDAEISELRAWLNTLPHLSNKNKAFSALVEIVESAIEDYFLDSEEKENILYHLDNLKIGGELYNLITADLQQLHGLLHGILADGEINQKEIETLEQWLENNRHLNSYYPYDEIYSIVQKVLADGIVDAEEQEELKGFFSIFVELKGDIDINDKKTPIENFCAFDPDISFEGKQFALTGSSSRGSRKELALEIEQRGGVFINNVSKNTNFLIYCGEKSDYWAFTCYGRKVEQAIKLRKEGYPIQIIVEADFWDAIEDFEVDI